MCRFLKSSSFLRYALMASLMITALMLVVSCGPKTPYEKGYALGKDHLDLKEELNDMGKYMERQIQEQTRAMAEYNKDQEKVLEFLRGYHAAQKEAESGE